jgi:hypothetical protein
MAEAFTAYRQEVEAGQFPAEEHSFDMKEQEIKELEDLLEDES